MYESNVNIQPFPYACLMKRVEVATVVLYIDVAVAVTSADGSICIVGVTFFLHFACNSHPHM